MPSYAAKYYCNGSYGDAIDAGLWDNFYNANSESDAASQAKEEYMGTLPGSYVRVKQCKKSERLIYLHFYTLLQSLIVINKHHTSHITQGIHNSSVNLSFAIILLDIYLYIPIIITLMIQINNNNTLHSFLRNNKTIV